MCATRTGRKRFATAEQRLQRLSRRLYGPWLLLGGLRSRELLEGGMAGGGEEGRAQRDRRPTARLAPAPARTRLGGADHHPPRTRGAGGQPAPDQQGDTLLPKKKPPEPGHFFFPTAT